MSFLSTAGSLFVEGTDAALFKPIESLWSDGASLWRTAKGDFESAFNGFKELIVHLFLFIVAAILFVGVLLLAVL